MIFNLIITFITAVLGILLNFLPDASPERVNKIADVLGFFFGKITILAYYYLPTDTIVWWIKFYFELVILTWTVKFMVKVLKAGMLKLIDIGELFGQ